MKDEREEAAWRDQCRRQLERDVMTRIKYGFCHVHKPVLDELPCAPSRPWRNTDAGVIRRCRPTWDIVSRQRDDNVHARK